jgi:hypothetical protein
MRRFAMKRGARSLPLLTGEQFHRISRAVSDKTRYDILRKVFASSGLTCGGHRFAPSPAAVRRRFGRRDEASQDCRSSTTDLESLPCPTRKALAGAAVLLSTLPGASAG